MIIENWTPHPIVCGGRVFEPCGKVVRCDMQRTKAGDVDGIDCYKTVNSGVSNAPAAAADTYYIVSAMVRVASGRSDFISPADFVRDAAGNIIGCQSFDIN